MHPIETKKDSTVPTQVDVYLFYEKDRDEELRFEVPDESHKGDGPGDVLIWPGEDWEIQFNLVAPEGVKFDRGPLLYGPEYPDSPNDSETVPTCLKVQRPSESSVSLLIRVEDGDVTPIQYAIRVIDGDKRVQIDPKVINRGYPPTRTDVLLTD